MDFTREGVFLAGIAHYPKFMEETIARPWQRLGEL